MASGTASDTNFFSAVVALTTAMLDGEPLEVAARAAGIGSGTLYRWMALARAGDPRFGPLAALVWQARLAGSDRVSLGLLSKSFAKALF